MQFRILATDAVDDKMFSEEDEEACRSVCMSGDNSSMEASLKQTVRFVRCSYLLKTRDPMAG